MPQTGFPFFSQSTNIYYRYHVVN